MRAARTTPDAVVALKLGRVGRRGGAGRARVGDLLVNGLAGIEVRFRANFAYIDGRGHDGTTLKLCRLRYGGSAHLWGFAIYRASHDDYEDSFLPTGTPVGTAEEALDCACGLYLNEP